MPQFAFVVGYGASPPESPDAIPMIAVTQYVDTDTNALGQFSVTFAVATGSNPAQIQSAAATAVRAFGATHGFGSLGVNAVIGCALSRG